MDITRLIDRFFYIYFNPRTNITKFTFNSNMWLYENQFWVEDDLSVFSSYYLSFCSESNSKKKEISNDINQFFIQYANIKHPKLHNEKNIINFYDLAISMVSIFYIMPPQYIKTTLLIIKPSRSTNYLKLQNLILMIKLEQVILDICYITLTYMMQDLN